MVGIVPAVENLPGGDAIRPGDVLRSASGKTIEVISTDAEGRLILADALWYARRFRPDAVVDIATLTSNIQTCLDRLTELGPNHLQDFDRSTIPTIKFNSNAPK